MVTKLKIENVIELLNQTPEQTVFDWKKDFSFPKDDAKRAEVIKDVAAIANGSYASDGYIFYGVNPNASDPIVGVSSSVDDAILQQFVNSKVDPPVKFLKYEIIHDKKKVIVIHIYKSLKRPHIISNDIGGLRRGQILIRKGSSTRGILRSDLFECFYDLNISPYFQTVLHNYQVDVNTLRTQIELIRILQDEEDRIDNDIKRTLGY